MAGFNVFRPALLALGLLAGGSASAQVVISQAYGGGGNSSATYNQDFVELFNRGTTAVSLNGWTIQYASASGTTWSVSTALPNVELQPGRYYLVSLAGGATGAALPTVDHVGGTGVNLSGTNGKVALARSSNAFSGTCPTGADLVDFVGFGSANCSEGNSAAPVLSNQNSAQRALNGCQDTDVNSADFTAAVASARNSATAANTCTAPPPSLSIADFSQVEGNSGPSSFEFAVTLSSPAPTGGVSFDATTVDGTATAGSDYVALSAAPFTIAAGATTGIVTVTVNGDTVDEADETFTVNLANVTGATVADGSAIGTITNDDAATAELSVANPADIAEGNSGSAPQNFTVSLAFALGVDVEFTATTANASASAGSDYTALAAAPFTIPAGSTSVQVPVQVLGDTVDEADETYTLTIASSSPSVTLGNAVATAVILDDDLPVSEIFEIQGAGVCSPFVSPCNLGANVTGNPVRTTANVVTAIGPAGFFVQTPDARDDNSQGTSNGIYVFTTGAPTIDGGAAIAVGDSVEIIGRAAEFFGLTQIAVNSSRDADNSIVRVGTGEALPSTVLFGSAGRGVPAETPSRDPDNLSCGALGNFECFEGMRVNMPNGRVTVSNQRFSSDLYAEVYVSPFAERGLREKGARFGNTLIPANLGAGIWDGNPEIIELDADTLIAANAGLELAGGTRFSATGVIGFDFGDYEFWPTELNIVAGSNEVVRPVPATKGELTIGSFNAFRFCDALQNSPSNCAATTALETDANRVIHQVGQVSAYIREVLRSPDVVGLQEVENLAILQQLATQISNDGGPAYVAYLVEGNDVGGIDVGYLVNPARIANVTVTQLAGTETWNDPSNGPGTLLHDRPPLLLAADFIEGGRQWRFHVINNHTRSRGGVDVSNADGERTRAKRFLQAVSIANLVQGLQTNAATANVPVIVIGDHNAYQFTDAYADVVGLIAGAYDNAENTCAPANGVTNCELPGGANIVVPAMINAVDVINTDERYSYKFTENFGVIQGSTGRDVATNQVLDHALFNQVAAPFVTGMAYGRANVDASSQRFRVCNYTNRDLALCPQGPGSWVPTGSSDHDGLVLVLQPPPPDAIFADGFED